MNLSSTRRVLPLGLIDELARTLAYSKVAARIESFGTNFGALLAQYADLAGRVAPTSAPRILVNDIDDDHVIAAAVAARAEPKATGDAKHLWPIGTHQGVAIVTAHEVVSRMGATGKTRPCSP